MGLYTPEDSLYVGVQPRLSSEERRILSARLCNSTEPEREVVFGSLRFSVYVAKDLGTSSWQDESACKLVVDARGSYYRYGDYPPLDEYDNKALVYLVRVCTPVLFDAIGAQKMACQTEEWISLRFIPGDGVPFGTPDFDEMCRGNEAPLAPLVQWLLFLGDRDFMKYMVTISRICGITPYFMDAKDEMESPILPQKHRHAAYCFALANREFFDVYPERYRYVTGIFRKELIERSLTLRDASGRRLPNFIPASTTLEDADIRVNRQRTLVYKFPSYFLQIRQLLATLKSLLDENVLTEQSIKEYLDIRDVRELFEDVGFAHGHFRKLGRLLCAEDMIIGSSITGRVLREIINREVADGPSLYVTKTDTWEESIWHFLATAHVTSV